MVLKRGFKALFRGRARRTQVAARQATTFTELFAQPSSEPAPSPHVLPRFKSTAADQVDRQHADRSTKIRMRLRAAFTPSQPVTDRRMFAGRTEVLTQAISSLEDQRLHLIVYGPRGIGKTSLLHILSEAAREARYLVHYSSCGAVSNFQETFRAAAAEIPLLYHSSFGPTAEETEAGSSFADLLPKSGFSPRQFGELCARLKGTRLIIVLDEFDRSQSAEFRRDVAELIKILSDRSVRVQLVIAGVAGDIVQLIEHIPSIRRNILAVRVPLMTDQEMLDLVHTGEMAAGLVYEPGARDLILKLAGGWPYIGSLIAQHAGLIAVNAGRVTVVADDVSTALDNALSELSSRIAKGTLVKLGHLKDAGMGRLLTLLARAALKAGGEFDAHDIEAVASTHADAIGAKRLLTQLVLDGWVGEEQAEAVGSVYRFIEDGLPPLLWFMGVRDEPHSRETRASA